MNFMQTRSTSYESISAKVLSHCNYFTGHDIYDLPNRFTLTITRKFKRTWTHEEKERESSQLFQNVVLKCKSSQGKKNSQSFCFFIKIISKEEIGSM
ncbi:hypothetical protein Avbf_18211 [Armadillidium vulgare]|nr:hypothetical protein Avbf_18211 [Armadillidium vulgare]